MLLIFCYFFLNQESYAKERFVELNLKQNDRIDIPIPLNENEIFFAGGWDQHEATDPKTGKWHYEADTFPARVYDLKTRKFKQLDSYLKTTRSYQGAIKYDNNNILILGGYCTKDCRFAADNYNIAENSFEKLDKTPLRYDRGTQDGLIKTNKQVFIVTELGIMEFDIKTKKFKKLLTFDNNSQMSSYNAKLVDGDNILIWGGDYYAINGKLFEGYKGRILKYNIPTNKIVELLTVDKPFYKNPIAHGIPLDNNRILLSVKGDEEGGTIYVYNYAKNEIEDWGKTIFGVSVTSGFYLGNNKVLLLGGIIDNGYEPFIKPTYLDYGILDLNTKKFSKVKKFKGYMFARYSAKVGKNKIFLGPEKNTKAIIVEY